MKGATFTGQAPCSPDQVVTPSATQCGQSCCCAVTSNCMESASTATRSHRAAVSGQGSRVENSHTGNLRRSLAQVPDGAVAVLGRDAEDRRHLPLALPRVLQERADSVHRSTP